MSAEWAGSSDPAAPVVLVHYGTPHSGRHLAPVAGRAAHLGLRVVTVARPGFGTSVRVPGRDVRTAAALALDAVRGVKRFATIGYSGGGPHAIATAALAPDRVFAVATFAGLTPFDDPALGEAGAWFDGMRDPGGLRAAARGRAAREDHQRTAEFEPESFTASDHEALAGRWGALGEDAMASSGAIGEVDDDVAFVQPWGIGLADVQAPVRLAHGDEDRVVPLAHGTSLARALRRAELRVIPGAGHIGVLEDLDDALRWIAERARADA